MRRLGLDRGADLGPVGEDLEGPWLASGVDLGPAKVESVDIHV